MPHQSKVERLQVACPLWMYLMTLSIRKTCLQGNPSFPKLCHEWRCAAESSLGFAIVVCQDTKSICIEFNRKRRLYPKSTFKQRSRSNVIPFDSKDINCTFVVWIYLKMSQTVLHRWNQSHHTGTNVFHLSCLTLLHPPLLPRLSVEDQTLLVDIHKLPCSNWQTWRIELVYLPILVAFVGSIFASIYHVLCINLFWFVFYFRYPVSICSGG